MTVSVNPAQTPDANPGRLDVLLPALHRLDRRLAKAVTAAAIVYGAGSAADRFRGLHIPREEPERLLRREPGSPALGDVASEDNEPTVYGERLTWLAGAFTLTPFDLDTVVIILAPEIDLRYERIYSYLQDDVTRRRPTVDLVLNLLCSDANERLDFRQRFASEAPLIHLGLVRFAADPFEPGRSLLRQYLELDGQIIDVLLAQGGLDPRLAPFCELDTAPRAEGYDPDSTRSERLRSLAERSLAANRPLRIYLEGPDSLAGRRAAQALAGALGAPLLAADLSRLHATGGDGEQLPRVLVREAWLHGAVLYLHGVDQLQTADGALFDCFVRSLAESRGITLVAGLEPWREDAATSGAVVSIPFPPPDFTARRGCWATGLQAAGIAPDDVDLDALAGRFRLSTGQIGAAIAAAGAAGGWRDVTQPLVTTADLSAAARRQTGQELEGLARKLAPIYTWHDLVAPPDALAQLREICARVAGQHQVLDGWGFGRRLSQGKGVSVLFAGPSGTGKTMAAEVIAGALGLDLFRIDLAAVVSKYIGETEKNLDRIFRAAENANGILFIDEAEALFGKRSEVRDAHDRYANIETAYLLQKMEQYEGVAILATNLRANMDEAFMRRLAFTVHFPFPDADARRQIWAGIWPAELPLADDLDLESLAQRFPLSGGNIKNVALAAAFMAADEGSAVTMCHVLHAVRREFQKLGKSLSENELTGSAPEPLLVGGRV